jgi:hypothetical protein
MALDFGPNALWLKLAIGLVVALGIAHSVLGERYILQRLFRRADLPALFGSDVFTKRTLRFAWHLTSIAWWGIAAAFVALGFNSARGGVLILAGMFAVSGIITLVASRGRHLAWVVLLVIGLFAWLGAP